MRALLSVPTRGSIGWATVTRLEEIRDAMALPPIIYQPGNLSVAQTRNKIVLRFLDTDSDVLVMVDDDVVPSPHFLERVLPFMDEWGMIGLPHPMPDPSNPSRLRLSVFSETEGGVEFFSDFEEGLHECDALATGCVAVSRRALESLGPHPFRISDDPSAEITSDDFLFCRDLRSAGFKIGYWWDGWYADHHSTVSLAPLMEAAMLERSTT